MGSNGRRNLPDQKKSAIRARLASQSSVPFTEIKDDVAELESDLAGLDASLAGKANTVHTHTISDVALLQTSLDSLTASLAGKAPSSHDHTWSSITDKPTTFTPTDHSHVINDTTGLQTALDAKAPLTSPTFTGTPTAPTPGSTDNTTRIATTAWVQSYVTANAAAFSTSANYALTGTWTFGNNVIINPASTLSFGSGTRQMLNLWRTSYGIGVQNTTQYYRTGGNFSWFKGGVHSDTTNDPGSGGTRLMQLDSTGRLTLIGNSTNQAIVLNSASNYYGIDFQYNDGSKGMIIQEAGGSMYFDFDRGSQGGELFLRGRGDTNRSARIKNDGRLQINSNGGHFELGAANTGYVHFITDRPAYYFDKRLEVNGQIKNYNAPNTQTSSFLAYRYGGDAVEWGHSNNGGYHATLGSLNVGGHVYMAFNMDHGTSSNTYRTRGIRGVALRTDHSGGLTIENVASANADNQVPSTRFIFDNAGNFVAGGNVTAYSDINLKTNIRKTDDWMDKVLQLSPVVFDWVDETKVKDDRGLIAQEVQKIAPELVVTNKETGILSVDYGRLVVYVIGAVQEMKKQLDELRK